MHFYANKVININVILKNLKVSIIYIRILDDF